MKLYLEGGRHLRAPMANFIRQAAGRPIDLNVVPCGSGNDAIKRCAEDRNALLLIDSEGPVSPQLFDRVAAQIGASNHAFFMVQMMEAWFLADRQTLADYYGENFRPRSLPPNPHVEEILKDGIVNGLRNAARACAKRGYRKGRDDADLLALLNHNAVYNACPNFRRLIDFLRSTAGS